MEEKQDGPGSIYVCTGTTVRVHNICETKTYLATFWQGCQKACMKVSRAKRCNARMSICTIYIYMLYTYKTTLCVIRRLRGGGGHVSHQSQIDSTLISQSFHIKLHNGFKLVSHRLRIDFTTMSQRFHIDYTPNSQQIHNYVISNSTMFTTISLRFHNDFTSKSKSISQRFHIECT